MHYTNAVTFAGYPVVEWKVGADVLKDGEPAAVAIRTGWDDDTDEWNTIFDSLLEHPRVQEIPALVIGRWHYDETAAFIVDALVANKAKFPNLMALFVGDITPEENEISWIKQADLSPLWDAFPNLEYLTMRGG